MTAIEVLNSTPQSRQLWYWRREMESCHRRRNVYPKNSDDWNYWNLQYVSAIKTYNELSGCNLKPSEN